MLPNSRTELIVQAFLARLRSSRLDDLASAVTARSDRRTDVPRDTSSAWTNVLLNTLLSMGAEEGWTTYPARRYWSQGKKGGTNSSYDRPERADDRGEYIFDACWTTYPRTTTGWIGALAGAPGIARPRLELSCECEWAERVGDDPTAESRAGRILDDFAKLIDAPARHRIMMFAYWDDLPFVRVVELCSRLAHPLAPGESFAMIGWHAATEWRDRGSAQVEVLAGDR